MIASPHTKRSVLLYRFPIRNRRNIAENPDGYIYVLIIIDSVATVIMIYLLLKINIEYEMI